MAHDLVCHQGKETSYKYVCVFFQFEFLSQYSQPRASICSPDSQRQEKERKESFLRLEAKLRHVGEGNGWCREAAFNALISRGTPGVPFGKENPIAWLRQSQKGPPRRMRRDSCHGKGRQQQAGGHQPLSSTMQVMSLETLRRPTFTGHLPLAVGCSLPSRGLQANLRTCWNSCCS